MYYFREFGTASADDGVLPSVRGLHVVRVDREGDGSFGQVALVFVISLGTQLWVLEVTKKVRKHIVSYLFSHDVPLASGRTPLPLLSTQCHTILQESAEV